MNPTHNQASSNRGEGEDSFNSRQTATIHKWLSSLGWGTASVFGTAIVALLVFLASITLSKVNTVEQGLNDQKVSNGKLETRVDNLEKTGARIETKLDKIEDLIRNGAVPQKKQ